MKAIFEDNTFENFYPFTLNHASFEIRVGTKTLLNKFVNLESDKKIILVVRDILKDVIEERYPFAIVNPEKIPRDYEEIHLGKELDETSLFQFSGFGNDAYNIDSKSIPSESSAIINSDRINISESAKVCAGVILDASEGQIIIDDNSLLDIGALVKGPAYIGRNTIVNPGAKLHDVAIGPYCKVGGEIEHTTFQGFSNKQHDGYLGNSFIGEWVNLGANTNNSDLKNNYSRINVRIGNNNIDAGMFAGCLIGDYSKTGISTMINTGTYIGLGCNVFGAGFQNKYIPNFSWGANGDKTDYTKFMKTLKIVKSRRDRVITPAEAELLKLLHQE